MKAGFITVAAAMVAGVSAHGHAHAHAHMHAKKHFNVTEAANITAPAISDNATCGSCYTAWEYELNGKTFTVPSPTPIASTAVVTASVPVVPVVETKPTVTPVTKSSTVTIAKQTTTTPAAVISTFTPEVAQPTAVVSILTPGVHTIPASTVTITTPCTVAGPTITSVPAGNATYGGITTVVVSATTVICPYAAEVTTAGVVTATVLTTTYFCPAAGTHTVVAPTTTSVANATTIVYATVEVFDVGVYTASEAVVTATVLNYVYYCPFSSSTEAAPVSTKAAVATSAAPVVAPVVTPVAAPSAKAVKVVPSTSVAAAVATKAASSSTTSGKLGREGNIWAITYTPYTSVGGLCKSASEVSSDIAEIASKGFSAVRLYSTDCSGLKNVGDACAAAGIKLILGVFIDVKGISGAAQQVTDLATFSHWSIVELVVIGNEAIFNGFCSASELAIFIASCRVAFKAVGYSGPITTTETLNVWESDSSALCSVIDVVGANLHPFFNSATSASEAGKFVASQLEIVGGLCPGKQAINLETGWPHAGSCNGAACPGVEEQKKAVASIQEEVGGVSVLFSYQDDMWKAPGTYGCEQFWGVAGLY